MSDTQFDEEGNLDPLEGFDIRIDEWCPRCSDAFQHTHHSVDDHCPKDPNLPINIMMEQIVTYQQSIPNYIFKNIFNRGLKLLKDRGYKIYDSEGEEYPLDIID